MKTRTLLLGSVLALALGSAGCVDNTASLEIQAICAPTDDCTFSEECDAKYIGYPTVDLNVDTAGKLWLILQAANQLPNNADESIGRANTNDAHIDGATVEYEGVPLPPIDIGSNFLVPAGGTSVFSAEVIPERLGAATVLSALVAAAGPATPAEIVAHLTVRGSLDDGTRFETGDFPITVRVCSGCLNVLQTCGDSTVGLLPTCPPNSNGQTPATCLSP